MLYVYTYLKPFDSIRKLCKIDLSKVSAENLADECDILIKHHNDSKIFLGYLEPGWMLDSKHEARIRRVIRKFDTYIVCIHMDSIPFSWKNEIDTLYLEDPLNHGHS